MYYRWREIGNVPTAAGIYAWYMSPEITNSDIDSTIALIEQCRSEGRDSEALDSARQLLDKALFRYMKEDPYTARLSGPLKPTFVGELTHESAISDGLLRRVVANPARLRMIKRIVEGSAPDFSSPLYIGAASNLRTRLLRHKNLIEAADEPSCLVFEDAENDADEHQFCRDKTFAERIRIRRIPPSRLFVVTQAVDGDIATHIDIENILNRLHFPLLGRN